MKNLQVLAIASVFLVSAVTVVGKFAMPQPVPIERLLASAESFRAANPTSAEAHYTLARIHYLAFARNSREVPAFGTMETNSQTMPRIAANWQIQMLRPTGGNSTNAPSDREMIAHATAALSGFREAIRLSAATPVSAPGRSGGSVSTPTEGLHQLGLASLLEQFTTWKERRPSSEALPSELSPINLQQARDAYLAAFREAYAVERRLPGMPASGKVSLVSYEAGNAFMRLAEKDADASKPDTDLAKAIAEVKEGVAEVSALPQSALTPIIFSLRSADSIQSLLAPELRVDFDLRGYGPSERWSWVKPETALLVWDPLNTGEITSAQQLFGGYTFEIFRADGYAALAALDDNRDGQLRGDELAGIRAWFDNNSDGRSEPGEVRDLADLGIAAIDVRATAEEGPHPMNPRGLVMQDGRKLPTWDWMVEPLKPLDASLVLSR